MHINTRSLGLAITILAIFVLFGTQVQAQAKYKPQWGTTPSGGVVSLSSLPQSAKNLAPGKVTVLPHGVLPPYSASVEKYREEQAASDTLKVTEDRDGNVPAPAGSRTIEGLSPSSSSTTQATLNENFQGIPQWSNIGPPDPVIAAGPNYVVEAVNLALAIYTKSGTKKHQVDDSTFFSSFDVSNDILSDPKVIYDQYAQRYVMIILDINFTTNKGNYLIAVSQTSDPTGSWYKYRSDATKNGNTQTTNWPDYPGLGYDSNAIYVTSNQYSFDAQSFQYAKIRIFNKSQLYNDQTVTYADFDSLSDNYGMVKTIKPAHHFGTTSTAYLLNTEPFGASSVTLWRIDNPITSPSISHTTVDVANYTSNSPWNLVPQEGSNIPIEGDNSETQGVVYWNGYLYTSFADLYNWGSGTVETIRNLIIDVSSNTTLDDIEYGADGYYYIYPSLYVDAYGEMAMIFSRSSSTEYPSVLYTYSTTDDPTSMTSSQILQAGEGAYTNINARRSNGTSYDERWGDYSGIALDPGEGDRFWFCGEFATNNPDNWSTKIGSITVPVPPLSVYISGSQYLDPGYSDDLTANASGGVIPYQYNWQIRYMPRGYNQWLSWSSFGNQRKELLDYNSSYQEAETEVTVTDANNSNASNTFYIYYNNTSTVTALSDPTPNPFNPTTVLNYSLAKPAHVKLMIYNIMGQQVATLVNADQTVGRYRKTFDASPRFAGPAALTWNG